VKYNQKAEDWSCPKGIARLHRHLERLGMWNNQCGQTSLACFISWMCKRLLGSWNQSI